MTRSGLADSPFFAPARPDAAKASPTPEPSTSIDATEEPSIAGSQPSQQATMQASMHASMTADVRASLVERIRRAVKDVGKESATFRFTPEEKKALLGLAFSFKVQGHKTSENELTRIAVNFVVEDHKQKGRNSILERVLDALKQ